MLTLILLWLSAALGGELVIDCKVPAHVTVDGVVTADLYRPGVLRLDESDGDHEVVVTVAGNPRTFKVSLGPEPTLLLVGRTGISVGTETTTPDDLGPTDVLFRTAGRARLMVQVGAQRVVVAPGRGLSLPLEAGEHEMTVRNPDGTSIFARGILTVRGGDDLVVQIGEGTLPETSGAGLSFQAGG